MIHTGISTLAPPGTYIRIAPRSGLALKGIDVEAGVVDPDYRGEIMVLMASYVSHSFQIEKGMRIAQLILERIVSNAEVVEVTELPQSSRASGGFGSTSYRTFLTMDPTNTFTPTENARLDAYFEHKRLEDLERANTRAEETAESGVPASSDAAGGAVGSG